MSEELTEGLLVHYSNRHLQVRWDYFQLCAYDKEDFNKRLTAAGKVVKDEPNQECMAKIMRLIETLANGKKTQWESQARELKDKGMQSPLKPKAYPSELSYGAIGSLLFHTHGESVIRNSVAVLLQRNYILREQATGNSIPCYTLNYILVQELLRLQSLGVEIDTSNPAVEIDTQSELSKSTPELSKSTPELSKSTGGGVDFDTNKKESKKGYKKSYKKEEDATQNTPVSLPTTTSNFSLDEATDDERKLASFAGLQPTPLLVAFFRDTKEKYPDYPLLTEIIEARNFLTKGDPKKVITDSALYENLKRKIGWYVDGLEEKAAKKQTRTSPKTTAEKIPTPMADIADAVNKRNNLPPVPTAQQQQERIKRMEQQMKVRKQA